MENPKIRFKGFTKDWEQRKLGALVGIYDGVHQTPDYQDSGIMFLSVENIATLKSEKYISEEAFERDYKVYPEKGDILMTRIGDVGTTNVVETAEKVAFYVSLALLKPNGIDSYFLSNAMKNNAFQKGLRERTLVTAIPQKINKDEIGKVDIFITNNDEEQKKMGSFFSNLDNLITLHQRKCEQTKNLKKYMLQKMFPQNGAKVPEIRFDGFTYDWEQRKVSGVAKIIAGGTPSTKENSYWEPKEIPWLSSGEVHKKYITFTDDMISQIGMNNSSAKMVAKDSVLIALAGQGKTRGTVAINRIPLTTNQSIAAMTFNEDFIPEFVFYNLENRYDELRRMSSGDGSRGGLNKQLVGDIEIPYTEKEEQERIGSFFESLDHLITLHQRKCDELKKMKKYMLQNMFI